MLRRAVALLVAATAAVACSSDDGSAEELCARLRSDPTITTVFRDFDPTDVEAALDQLRTGRVTLGELRDAAPSEVRDDLTVEIDYLQALIDGLREVADGDPADAVAVVQEVTAEHPDVEEAAANLTAFTEESCGS